MSAAVPLLALRDIVKRFGGVTALDGVSFDIAAGAVHCLVGENGAGKSTLVKIMAGSVQPDAGRIALAGETIRISSPQAGLDRGIGVVYQELELVPNLSIMENIALGREPRTRWGMIDRRRRRAETEAVLRQMGIDLAPERIVGELTVAQAQLVAIAKILAMAPRILVLDEPTAALSGGELETLYALVGRLKARGVGVVYISHRLDEVFRLGDQITVLRDGRHVLSAPAGSLGRDALIQAMVGRKSEQFFPERPASVTPLVALAVRGLSTAVLRDVGFDLHAGEVLGCAGLAGCGIDALARALIGAEPIRGGSIAFGGTVERRLTPRRALARGVALVPEDRKGQGLVLGASVADNASLSRLGFYARWGVIDFRRLMEEMRGLCRSLRVRAASLDQTVASLSGGNQQKVVLARALSARPDVLVLDEPTRGIDVGAKAEIYQLIVDLARQGRAILLMSSELEEVMALSHRLLVFAEGRVTATLTPPYRDTQILALALPARGERPVEVRP